jgi:hypothetical protein
LTEAENQKILATLRKGITASPVLSAFGVAARANRGRFYIERQRQEEDAEPCTKVWGRITPLAGVKNELLLEKEYREGSWSEIAQGAAGKLIKVIASDTEGTFHGLGALDRSLRKLSDGQDRLRMTQRGKGKFVYADTGEKCTVQEALFHYFGLPLQVIAEPAVWYRYHRTPRIVESNKDRTRVLVRFTAESMSGETFGGTCLYVIQEGQWEAYTIRPSESSSIAQAEAWLVKRKWQAWC